VHGRLKINLKDRISIKKLIENRPGSLEVRSERPERRSRKPQIASSNVNDRKSRPGLSKYTSALRVLPEKVIFIPHWFKHARDPNYHTFDPIVLTGARLKNLEGIQRSKPCWVKKKSLVVYFTNRVYLWLW